MDREQILSEMKAYFAELHEPAKLEGFESIRAADLIEDSVDAITFIMHLEDKTGRDIPTSQVAEGFTGLTFQDLAAKLCTGELGVVRGTRAAPSPALR